MNKRILALILAMVMVMGLAGCGKGNKKNDNSKPSKNETTQSQKENNKEDEEETKETEEDTDKEETSSVDIPKELKTAVDAVINSTANEEDIMDKVVDYSNETVNTVKYYTSDLLNKALAKSETFNILVKSDEVKVTDSKKVSKTEWKLALVNELGDKKVVEFIKIDDKWLMNIHSMVTVAKLNVAGDVKITVNGTEVPVEYIESKVETAVYSIPGLLNGVTNTVEHETGFAGTYKGEFVASSTDEVKLRYELSEAELATMLPELETMFNEIYAAAVKGDVAKIASYLADNTKLDANAMKESLSKIDKPGYKLTNLEKRNDEAGKKSPNLCFLYAKDAYRLNLKAKMAITGGMWAGYTPTEFNSIDVVKTPDGLKIVDASPNVWMSEVNATQKD